MFKKLSQVPSLTYLILIAVTYSSQECSLKPKSEYYFPQCKCSADYSLYACSNISSSDEFNNYGYLNNAVHQRLRNNRYTYSILYERIKIIDSDIRDLQIQMKINYQAIEIWCNTIDIHDTLLENIAFTNVYFVKKVILKRNQFKKILSKYFSSLVDLEHLDLSHNLITEIEPHSFDQNKNLTELFLYTNNIKMISSNVFYNWSFPAHSPLSIIDLSNNPLDVFEIPFGSHLRDLKINNASLSDSSMLKITESERNCEIENLEISHNNLTHFPDDLLRYLYNSKLLNMSYNMIDIDEFSMLGLVSLRELYLHHNRISKITKHYFIKLKGLMILNLSHNLISNIEPNSFYQTDNIDVLILAHNSIREIPKDLFKNFTKIVELDLSFNSISEFNYLPLINETPTIEKLFFSNNYITAINENLFSGQSVLKHNRNMRSLSDYVITDLTSIEEILIDNVNLKGETLIFHTEKLKTLSASKNHLESINSSSFIELKNLKYLDLSFNNLHVIENEVFDSLEVLRELNLHHNNLSNLSSSLFLNLASLNFLDLSFNQIIALPYGLLDSTVNLEVLNISNNNLTHFERLNFHTLKNLQILNIESNRISRIDGIAILENLKKIYIHNNYWNCEKLYQLSVQLERLNIESAKSIGVNYSRPIGHNIKGVRCDGPLRNLNLPNYSTEQNIPTEDSNYLTIIKNITLELTNLRKTYLNNTLELINLRKTYLKFMNDSNDDRYKMNDILEEFTQRFNNPVNNEAPLEIKHLREDLLKFIDETKTSREISSGIQISMDNISSEIKQSTSISYVFLVIGLGITFLLGGLVFIFIRTKFPSRNGDIPLT